MAKLLTQDKLQSKINAIITEATAKVTALVRHNIGAEITRIAQVALAGPILAGVSDHGSKPSTEAPRSKVPAAKKPSPQVARQMECPSPGCKNPSKGPRFSWFCAEHRELPADEKEKILVEWRARRAVAQSAIGQKKEEKKEGKESSDTPKAPSPKPAKKAKPKAAKGKSKKASAAAAEPAKPASE
jgi:hypothetical protein